MTKPRPAGVAGTVPAMGFPGPARTQGTLGYGDAADPNVTTRLGDTPGTAGRPDGRTAGRRRPPPMRNRR